MGYSHNKGYSAIDSGYAVGKKGSEVQIIDATGNITLPASKNLILTTEQFVKGQKFAVNYNFAAADVAKTFFIAPAACKVLGAKEAHGTASAGAINLNVEKLTAGKGAGSGVSTLATAIAMTASAITVRSVGAVSTANGTLAAGDRLALRSASGAATNLANACITLTMQWV